MLSLRRFLAGLRRTKQSPARVSGGHRFLFLICSTGLANRLLAIAGGKRLAERLGRELIVYWPANSALNGEFRDLFDNNLWIFRPQDVVPLFNMERRIISYGYNDFIRPDDAEECMIIKATKVAMFEGETDSEAVIDSVVPALCSFTPAQRIRDEIDAFTFPPGPVVGVHIRRGGGGLSTAELDPPRAREHFAQSTNEQFVAAMQSLLDERPGISFFLSTDSPEVEKLMAETFGASVIVFPKQGEGRGSLRGSEEAIIDLYLLARTRAVIATHWSSFSVVAGRLGGIPAVLPDNPQLKAIIMPHLA